MAPQDHIVVSSETEIDLPPNRKFMGVDRKEWGRLKKLVSRISDMNDYWQNAAWSACATTVSFFISTITTTGLAVQPPNFLTMLTAISLVATAILFIADYAVTKTRKVAKQDIVEFMQEIEVQSTSSQQTAPQEPVNPTSAASASPE